MHDEVVALDNKGEAKIGFPDWLTAIDKKFRYHLITVGDTGSYQFIAEERVL